jgi:SAM-dependent methyltransferase
VWRQFSSRLKNLFRQLGGKSQDQTRIEKLYQARDYLDAYSEHTDIRVARDPREAVGGMWEEIGKLQFDFLISNGLRPYHTLLDIGCGTLRGGRHFIKYLDVGNYSGLDISPKAIEYAKQLVVDENMSDRHPKLLVSSDKDLSFNDFSGKMFDYLLAQSVFTHLMPQHIEQCFRHIGRLMRKNSVFFFTFWDAPEYTKTGDKAFRYPYSFFQSLAGQYGFRLSNRSEEYRHPRRQQMAVLSKI